MAVPWAAIIAAAAEASKANREPKGPMAKGFGSTPTMPMPQMPMIGGNPNQRMGLSSALMGGQGGGMPQFGPNFQRTPSPYASSVMPVSSGYQTDEPGNAMVRKGK